MNSVVEDQVRIAIRQLEDALKVDAGKSPAHAEYAQGLLNSGWQSARTAHKIATDWRGQLA